LAKKKEKRKTRARFQVSLTSTSPPSPSSSSTTTHPLSLSIVFPVLLSPFFSVEKAKREKRTLKDKYLTTTHHQRLPPIHPPTFSIHRLSRPFESLFFQWKRQKGKSAR
jgi:hypothetical protein